MKHVLTIDAGTGSGRALVFDFKGNQVAAASREWTMPALPEYPGSAVFDTKRAWKLLCECTQEVLGKSALPPSEIAAVTATSMREGFVLYDEAKSEIWACPNVDARAGEEAAQLIREGLDEIIYRTGGDGLAITAPPRLRWIARHEPKVFESARHFSMISDWVLFKLSGEIVTDPSCGSSSGLFDLKTNTWSPELLKLLNLPNIFPAVVPPGTIVGGITTQAARQTGLAPGTQVIVAGADTQLGLLGSAGAGASPLTVVGGTFWQTALLTNQVLLDPKARLRTLAHVLPGHWMTEGIGFLNGLAMRWVRDTVCADLSVRAKNEGVDVYALMERLTDGSPAGSVGIFALVSDVMNAKRWLQAPTTFVGLNVSNPDHSGDKGRGLLVRATQESAAFTARAHWDILSDLSGSKPDSLTFCGGASKGKLWPQIMADVFELPVRIPKVKEATSLGASFCGLVGLKEYQNLAEAAQALVQWERIVKPDDERSQSYGRLRAKHAALQSTLIELVHRGTLEAMWRAPGV